ncbi:MAG: STAS domain-containing protein [Bacillota bacterium]
MNGFSAGNTLIRSVRQESDTLVVAVSGEIDLSNSPVLRNRMLDLIAKRGPKRVVMNLGLVPYMDSSAVAVLVELLRKMGKGKRVVLTDLQPRVKGLLEIARLDTIFAVAKTEQEAMAAGANPDDEAEIRMTQPE